MNNMDNQKFIKIYEKNTDHIYQICYMYLKNKHDAEDATQNTFIKLYNKNIEFESEQHTTAWLIVTASNICKNNLKYWFRSKTTTLDIDIKEDTKEDNILELILQLPEKYKLTLYLYYYLGYKTKEISQILGINESTVRSHLSRGRDSLKNIIKEEIYE